MLSAYMFEQIRALINEGQSDRAIAKALKCNRKTVAKYRESNGPPRLAVRTHRTRPDPLDKFTGRVEKLLTDIPTLSGEEIFVLLKSEGCQASLRSVQRRRKLILGSIRPKERFFEQAYEPGEQAQFDFKESVRLPFVTGEKVVNLHFGTLPYSGFFHITAFQFKNFEAFIAGVHEFFNAAGGLTQNIRFDNLSPCVSKIGRGSNRTYTKNFERAVAYYGFGLLPCAPSKGSEKGDVEREIRTQTRRIINAIQLSGKVFYDLDDLNSWLRDFCREHQLNKIKSLWLEEKSKLKPVPEPTDEILGTVEIARVSSHGTARALKATFSLPDQYIGQMVRVVSSASCVKIYAVGEYKKLICTHPRLSHEESSVLLEHVLPSLLRKPHAMVRWAHKDILFPNDNFKKLYANLQKKLGYAAESEFLKVMNLIHHTTLPEITAATELVLAEKNPELNFYEEIKCLVTSPDHHQIHGNPNLKQTPLNPALTIYDELIPQLTNLKDVS